MGFLEWLWHHVARRHLDELGAPAGERLLHEHAGDRLHRVLPHLVLAGAIDQEATQLRPRARLPRTELHPPVGDEVQRGHTLGHPGGVVDRRRDLDDPVAEADPLGALAPRAEEELRRRGVRVLLEEVVLHFPYVVEAEPGGELDLLERVLHQTVLGALLCPGTGVLVLVEESESHCTDAEAGAGILRPAGRGSRSTSTERAPRRGAMTIERRQLDSGRSEAASRRARRRIVRSTIFISKVAKLAPRQRRTPPPKGIQL